MNLAHPLLAGIDVGGNPESFRVGGTRSGEGKNIRIIKYP